MKRHLLVGFLGGLGALLLSLAAPAPAQAGPGPAVQAAPQGKPPTSAAASGRRQQVPPPRRAPVRVPDVDTEREIWRYQGVG